MQRPIVTVPRSLLRRLDMTWDIDWRGQDSGDGNDGNSQVVHNAFPRWVGEPQSVLTREDIRLWRAVRAEAQGRLGIYRIHMIDPVGFNILDAGASKSVLDDGLTFSTGQPFSSGKGFSFEPFVVAQQNAAKGATSIRVDISASDIAPQVGQIMSHSDWPFIITSVEQLSNPNRYDLTIQMPLREAIKKDDVIHHDPVGRFEAVNDTTGFPGYGVNQVSRPTLQLREVLVR